MKGKLLLLTSFILLFTFAAFGQQNPQETGKTADNKKGLEELEKTSKDLMRMSVQIMQSPMKQLTKTKDVKQEAEKYFQAWMNGDAAAILAYQPPFVVKATEEANKILAENLKETPGAPSGIQIATLEETKSYLNEMSKKFKYEAVEIGEITETGILDHENAPKEKIFVVLKYKANVVIEEEKDIINGNIVGYTDGEKWYFVNRAGLPEKVLKWLSADSPAQK